MPMPLSSAPSGSSPLFGKETRHGDTRAAIDMTLAIGPIVAASSGIAVEANHHDLSHSTVRKNARHTRQTPNSVERPMVRRGRGGSHWGRSSLRPRSLKKPMLLIVPLRPWPWPSKRRGESPVKVEAPDGVLSARADVDAGIWSGWGGAVAP